MDEQDRQEQEKVKAFLNDLKALCTAHGMEIENGIDGVWVGPVGAEIDNGFLIASNIGPDTDADTAIKEGWSSGWREKRLALDKGATFDVPWITK